MTKGEIRKIIREEIQKILREGLKKGDKVDTHHGPGEVLSISGEQARVKLGSGAVVKVHRDRAVPRN
jgi:preprotein translocase subunit YajC